MLKKLFGMLGDARQALSGDMAVIRQGVSGLEFLDASLAQRLAEFIATGAGSHVLLDLRKQPHETGALLGDAGRIGWRFTTNMADKAILAAGAKSRAGRHKLYQRVGNDDDSVALLVRLAKVLEAADQARNLKRTTVAMPDWLQYLLNDALWSSFPDGDDARQDADRPAWDVNLVRALLVHDGFPPAMVLPIIFERKELDTYFQDKMFPRLLAPGALDEYMLAHADDVGAAAAMLSASARTSLVNRIGDSQELLAAFAPLMVKLAVGDSRTVRTAAARLIDSIDKTSAIAHMDTLLRTGTNEERANAADLLARIQGEAALPVLEAALAAEKGKPVQQAIRMALSRLRATDGGGALDLPEPPPLPPPPASLLADDAIDLLLANRVELLEQLRKSAEEEVEQNRSRKQAYEYEQEHYARYRKLSDNQLRTAIEALNGQGGPRALAVLKDHDVLQTLTHKGRLEARADFGLGQVMRLTRHSGRQGRSVWFDPIFQTWLRKQDKENVDLRQLAALASEIGRDAESIAVACMRDPWNGPALPQHVLPAHRVWPLFAASPELIDEGLGMAPAQQREYYSSPDIGFTLSVLETFPVITGRWLPRVMELALGEGKTHRAAAQEVLARHPGIGQRVCEALGSTKQELRIEAARWLDKLGYREGVPALREALAKESRETVSAALMTALENLGEDLSAHLAPDVLLAQARKGLKGKPPAGMAWLKLDGVPACTWADGTPVEPEIIRWWVVLACKLKEPGGNALLERYLGLLAQPARAALGTWVLHQFIARDTANAPLEEAIEYARQQAPQQYQYNQDLAARYPDYHADEGKMTLEQVFEAFKREKLGEYLGSAINEKGLLALIWGTPGHQLVSAIQLYIRDHYQRRAQLEALLEGACISNDPAVIQFTLGIARRYRTASVQEKARALVQRIAERNGWTQDQLADRTVPTGGLDESGTLVLPYGSRQYTVTLDAAMKPVLRNEDGKTVSALPAPRQDDAPDAIKEGKQLLATCKKELKQVVDMQTSRLYEAMCTGRSWPAAEWRQYLQQHPIVGRLAQRLVWMADDGSEGGEHVLFRPTEDGSLIDASDDDVEVGDSARISLAHGSLIDAGLAAAWLAHIKDYKLTPLFPQLNRQRPPMADRPGADCIDDRVGWISDTFKLRSAFTKLGYQRGSAEDGGVFVEYTKRFAGVGLTVVMEFSGSTVPEENRPAALKTLWLRGSEGYYNGVALNKIPPVLLAEAYGDYLAVAKTCAGFDPAWESKMPW
jgi:hypothetical protein